MERKDYPYELVKDFTLESSEHHDKVMELFEIVITQGYERMPLKNEKEAGTELSMLLGGRR